jgi:hypothetical protein
MTDVGARDQVITKTRARHTGAHSSAAIGSDRSGSFGTEAPRWSPRRAIDEPQQWTEMTMLGATAGVVHLAYHVGAIRQLSKVAAGARAPQ